MFNLIVFKTKLYFVLKNRHNCAVLYFIPDDTVRFGNSIEFSFKFDIVSSNPSTIEIWALIVSAATRYTEMSDS